MTVSAGNTVLTRITARGWQSGLIAGLALLVVALYVGFAAIPGDLGFPLDDSWIHQTYARNFARTGRWEFFPGVASAGSTSPLWTLLLAFGYRLNIPHMLWTHFLGWLSLVWTAWAGMSLWQLLWPSRIDQAWVVGALLILSWPLVWAAGSGMETLLFIALELQVLVVYSKGLVAGNWRIGSLGLLSGALVLTRPEGAGLILLLAVAMIFAAETKIERFKRGVLYLAAAAMALVPYFLFNWWLSGNIWPNTFYAKQAEYAELWLRPFWQRFAQLLYFSLGGPAAGWRGISAAHLLLLPGLITASWLSVRADLKHKRLLHTVPILWALGLVFVYAWRLPVTYHHGRYLWPALPIWILYGVSGWQDLSQEISERLRPFGRFRFLGRSVTALTFAALLLVFLLLGLQVYSDDVAFINAEMVDVANWLREHTTSETLVAAHDIGAIGFFAERPILDLAGLISPEVIPLLSDEKKLIAYILEGEATYLVTAPGWPYASLTTDERATLMYSTEYAWTQQQGFNNMAIYRIDERP